MLKPFQIRDLHVPLAENLYDSTTESTVSDEGAARLGSNRHGTIQLSAPEYDEIASNHPRARLTYMDDDDGEIITVGSSFELAQRLDDAIDISTLPPSSQSRDDATPMHIFDIRRSNSVTELWKNIERRSSMRRDSSEVPESQSRGSSGCDFEMSNSFGLGHESVNNSSSDLRSRWFEACNPPRLPSKEERMSGSQNQESKEGTLAQSLSSGSGNGTPASILKEPEPAAPSSSITAEGKRQAEEAGIRLRGWRQIVIGNGAVPSFTLSPQTNPWTSYKPLDVLKNAAASNLEEARQAQSSPHITAEGRRQAEEAGSGLSGQTNLQTGNGTVPQENPWTSHESSNAVEDHAAGSGTQDLEGKSPLNPQDEPQPLLAAFEAEMAKILESSTSQPGEESSNPPTEAREDRRADSDSSHRPRPGEVLTQALKNLAGGVEALGSELKSRIPELERRASYAQRALPEHVGTTLQAALTSLDSHIKNLANVVQDASVATGHAADMVRQAELRSAEQVVDGLGKMVGELGQMGRTLFAAFEAEFGRWSSGTQTETLDQAASASQSTSQEEESQADPISANEPVADATSTNDHHTASVTTAHSDVESDTRPDSNLASSHPSKQTGDSSQLLETSPENHTPVPAQARPPPNWTPFSNWPNRSALVPPLPPSRPNVPTLNSNVDCSPQEPGAVQSQPSSESSRAVKDSLFIGNVGFNVTEKMIEDVFVSKGFLAEVHLPTDSETGKHAGFGYAHFRSTHSARAALEALQGAHIDGHAINLEFSDHSPIDTLQSPPPVPDRGTKPSIADTTPPTVSVERPSPSQGLHHRQSGHPASKRTEQVDSRRVSFMDGLNSTSPRRPPPFVQPRNDSSALLDQSEESAEFAARYPSLLPSRDTQQAPQSVPDRLLTLSPNSEMARFPPVSQLDAHILASQYRFSRPKPDESRAEASRQEGQQAPERPAVPTEPRSETGFQQHARSRLRRSRPMMPAATAARLSSPFNPPIPHIAPAANRPLRRSATEIHSRRNRTREYPFGTRPFGFTDLDRAIPGSFPADEPASAASGELASDKDMEIAIKLSIIDNCVDTLVSLGYGTERDGGLQRLRMYAEAVGGKVSDAIEMIEEDRRAYAQRDSSTL
ncbi:hypothetical protein VTN77DRAFT_3090 [Rasamsonia byssochlamydoides]|uniref:uncharacterized protein n=1 Tax=Rasamsonia byssochlamydoides TaxID=89139 RepID=UPI0037424DA4